MPASPSKKRSLDTATGPTKKATITSDSSSSSSTTNQPIDTKSQLLSLLKEAGANGLSQDQIGAADIQINQELLTALNDLASDGTVSFNEREIKVAVEGGAPVGSKEVVYVINNTIKSRMTSLLSQEEGFVYQQIIKSGDRGIWTKEIKQSSGLPTQTLTKIYKSLEGKRLVKSVKSVASKSKKLYMGYDITPNRSITGGPWYTESEFDFEFIATLGDFILRCIKQRGPVTLGAIAQVLAVSEISKVRLSVKDVELVVRTMVHDGKVEEVGGTERDIDYLSEESDSDGEAEQEEDPENQSKRALKQYVCANPQPGHAASSTCFKSWELLEEGAFWRPIQFGESGGVIAAMEPHHHS